jgi:hypothetical protein
MAADAAEPSADAADMQPAVSEPVATAADENMAAGAALFPAMLDRVEARRWADMIDSETEGDGEYEQKNTHRTT